MRIKKGSQQRAFTIIELVVIIGLIGILSSVLVVGGSSARKKAKEAHVLAEIRSAQKAISQCLYHGKVMYCGLGIDCDSSTAPVAESPLCGVDDGEDGADASYGLWPDVSQYGFSYNNNAGSEYTTGHFVFFVKNDTTGTAYCCTQKDCVSFTGTKEECRTSASIGTED
jgi:type II secretory pathway pseudopilin PulG